MIKLLKNNVKCQGLNAIVDACALYGFAASPIAFIPHERNRLSFNSHDYITYVSCVASLI